MKYSIKTHLLNEAAIALAELPVDVYIGIDDMEDEIAIFYCDADGESLRLGNINMEQPPRAAGPCNDAYLVTWVEAEKGYGPLLYDLAMEYATRKGNGLTADRKTVQDDAIKVWDYYATRRADVNPTQLDAYEDRTDKSCRMKAAKKNNPNWKESSLSKSWKKADDLLKQLEISKPPRIIYL
jgi:hypothetical protein